MNGRMYDSNLGRFLSPDNFIQDPFNTQHYNRYGYVWNNPLSYVDINGEDPIIAFVLVTIFTYLKGAHDNRNEETGNWEWNPFKWNKVPSIGVSTEASPDGNGGINLSAQPVIIPTGTSTPLPLGPEVGWHIDLDLGNDPPVDVGGEEKEEAYSGNNIFLKTYRHFQVGGRKPLNISTSSLDFSSIKQSDLSRLANGNYGLDLYKIKPSSQEALSLGKISLTHQGNNEYFINPDYYDFNIEWQNGFSKRNIATFGAGALHYGINPVEPIYPMIPLIFGGAYWIHFQGNINIKP